MKTAAIPFAPLERAPLEVVCRQAAAFRETPLISALINASLHCVFVLNAQRQIVFASQNAQALAASKTPDEILGQRPGEALGCLHADCEGGCGSSVYCAECGAAKAALSGLAGRRDLQECRMTRRNRDGEEESLDLLVLATPLVHSQEHYALLAIADISHEKRRRVLERVFFHDAINLAGGVDGMLSILKEEAPPPMRGDLAVSHAAAHELLEAIQTQRDLTAAERAELVVSLRAVRSGELLQEVAKICRSHPVAEDRRICLAEKSADAEFTTDPVLLKRILFNLVKNAVEACAAGQTVTIGCEASGGQVRFTVHNPSVMPRPVQLQIFQRSFTTKGVGRGLGTYSVKLLTEKYLKGQVRFTTSPEEGTTFFVTLPRLVPT